MRKAHLKLVVNNKVSLASNKQPPKLVVVPRFKRIVNIVKGWF